MLPRSSLMWGIVAGLCRGCRAGGLRRFSGSRSRRRVAIGRRDLSGIAVGQKDGEYGEENQAHSRKHHAQHAPRDSDSMDGASGSGKAHD